MTDSRADRTISNVPDGMQPDRAGAPRGSASEGGARSKGRRGVRGARRAAAAADGGNPRATDAGAHGADAAGLGLPAVRPGIPNGVTISARMTTLAALTDESTKGGNCPHGGQCAGAEAAAARRGGGHVVLGEGRARRRQ